MKKIQIISGPCSAESEMQVMKTAEALRTAGIDWFRAGLWKPRTRPGSFEGMGEKAIPWMQRVRDEFGMRICTEAACAKHVFTCRDAGFDMLWIGARTTSDVFSVQEIAEALKGSGMPVFVKNPMSQDIGLWAGAVERLMMQGIKNIGLIHRGFASFERSVYRNLPKWKEVISMRSLFPELPLLCDPSHIAGDARYVGEIAQKALDLGLDGLMVECHCDPKSALSDAGQQLTPDEFISLLNTLNVRSRDNDSPDYRTKLSELRSEIDLCDETIVEALARRMKVSEEIGRIKRENNVSIIQPGRWDEVIEAAILSGKDKGLDESFIRDIFNEIHKASVTTQEQ